jgi:hypothetical protein
MKRVQRADLNGGGAGVRLVKKTVFSSAAVGVLLAAALAVPASAVGSTETPKDLNCATATTTLVKGRMAEFGADGKAGTSGALVTAKRVDRDAQEALVDAQDSYAKAKVKYDNAKAADDTEDQAASARIDTPADAEDAALAAAKTDRDTKTAALSEADAKYKAAQEAHDKKDQTASTPADTPAAATDTTDTALAAAKTDRNAKATALSEADAKYKAAKAADATEDQAASARIDTPADASDAALVAAQTDRDAKATTLSEASIKAKTAHEKLIAARQAENDAAGAVVAAQFVVDRVCAPHAHPDTRPVPGPAGPAGPAGSAGASGANGDNGANGVAPSIPSPSDTSQIGQVPVGPVNTGDGSLP